MAFEIKKRAKEFDNMPEIPHEDRLLQKRERDFIENDKKTFESIVTAYEAHREIMDNGTQDDRIMHYSTLHIQRGFASYLIGEGFIEEEERIKSGDSQYKSLNQLFESNEKKLPFDKKTMYQYIQIAKAVTFDDFRKLGVKKTLIVAQVKDEKKREQVIKVVADKKIDESGAREYVNNLFEREMERNRIKKDAVREEALDDVKYHLITTGSPVDITFRLKERKYKEAASTVLGKLEERIKLMIMEEYKRQTGR